MSVKENPDRKKKKKKKTWQKPGYFITNQDIDGLGQKTRVPHSIRERWSVFYLLTNIEAFRLLDRD